MNLRRPVSVCALFLLAFPASVPAQDPPERTAIDDYVGRADDSYKWKIVRDKTRSGVRQVIVDMTSQAWLTRAEVNRPEWRHWLSIAIPVGPHGDTGMLWIGGGANGRDAPGKVPRQMQQIALATRSVVAHLGMVPNQPLEFYGDGQMRVEDDLIGYSWDRFLKTGDPKWPARNAMIKSAVRAMDTVTAVTAGEKGVRRNVNRFVVVGASKRGWTTWLTGAMDDRVVAIVPIVIDVLNVPATARHHFAAYGFWAPAFGNYVEHRITQRMDTPEMKALMRLVDPFQYRHRLTLPKFIVNAAGDQFFPPDSSQYYFDELPGEKHLRVVPNTDHGLGKSDAIESVVAWYSLVLAGKSAPGLKWTLDGKNVLRVVSEGKPKEVRLWQATNPDARDFRLESLGPRYTSRVLSAGKEGTYEAALAAPERGWTAHFIEMTYDVGAAVPLKTTTRVYVLPDILPFEKKASNRPVTITVDMVAPDAEVAARIRGVLESNEGNFAVAKMNFSSRPHAGGDGTVDVRLNWKPTGRFWTGAGEIRGWLTSLGCTGLSVRLESGEGTPFSR